MVDGINNPAFDALADIERRSYGGSVARSSADQSGRFWTGVGFRLNDQHYVAPLEEVSEILRMPEYTRVPGARSWVKGLANIRGTLLPLMDLHGFLGRAVPASLRQQRVLVVEHQGINSGILVDEVLGLQHFEKSDKTEQVEDDERIQPYLDGCFNRGEEEWRVFSPYALAEHPDFMKVAL